MKFLRASFRNYIQFESGKAALENSWNAQASRWKAGSDVVMEVNTVLRNRWGHITFYLQDNVGKHLLVSGDFSSDFPNRNSYLALATLWECADAVLPQTNVSACSESETKASL